MIFLFLLTVIYIFTKYILLRGSYKYKTKLKWWAVLGSLRKLHKIIMKQKSAINHDVIHKYNQHQKLSDDELEYIMYNGNNTERRSARIILEERIKNQVKQHNKHTVDTSCNSEIVPK